MDFPSKSYLAVLLAYFLMDSTSTVLDKVPVPQRSNKDLPEIPRYCMNPDCNKRAEPGKTHCSAECFKKHIKGKK